MDSRFKYELITSDGLTFSKYTRASVEFISTVELINGLYALFKYNEADDFKTIFVLDNAPTFKFVVASKIWVEGSIIFSGA